ncbi:MAG: hypothetical protein KDJ87_16640, partial [Rhizobiaceae bacterium]|nr:hypothetical protein [Rhizobiaceae bacterium]
AGRLSRIAFAPGRFSCLLEEGVAGPAYLTLHRLDAADIVAARLGGVALSWSAAADGARIGLPETDGPAELSVWHVSPTDGRIA